MPASRPRTISQLQPKPPRVLKAWANGRNIFDTTLLQRCREESGLTLREVAGYSGVSIATLDRMERGFQCELSSAMKLAKFWELPIEQLWKLKGKDGDR